MGSGANLWVILLFLPLHIFFDHYLLVIFIDQTGMCEQNTWITTSGYILGTFAEQACHHAQCPLMKDSSSVSSINLNELINSSFHQNLKNIILILNHSVTGLNLFSESNFVSFIYFFWFPNSAQRMLRSLSHCWPLDQSVQCWYWRMSYYFNLCYQQPPRPLLSLQDY